MEFLDHIVDAERKKEMEIKKEEKKEIDAFKEALKQAQHGDGGQMLHGETGKYNNAQKKRNAPQQKKSISTLIKKKKIAKCSAVAKAPDSNGESAERKADRAPATGEDNVLQSLIGCYASGDDSDSG